jgi:hypothetical protein
MGVILFPATMFGADPTNALVKTEIRSLKDCLQPALKKGGFAMDGFMLWCSSVIKVGETYHMFASRWPAKYGLGGWTKYSECVRATSTSLLGPYTFQEVVLQKRTDHWDKSRIHNVKIIRADGKFLLFYINSANQTGCAVSDAVTGPWTRSDRPVILASNPAPLARPDGSIYVFCRLRDPAGVNRGVVYTAPGYQGPYTVVAQGDNLLPDHCELEDPTIWWANQQYNLLVNDWKSKATGIFKAGAQYYSTDGIHYQFRTREPVFTKTVPYDDGTSETFSRRERPFVYPDEHGAIIALFTACLPKEGASRIVVQPVKNYYPEN